MKYKPTCVKCNTSVFSALKVWFRQYFCWHHYEVLPLRSGTRVYRSYDKNNDKVYTVNAQHQCHKCFHKIKRDIQLFNVVETKRGIESFSLTEDKTNGTN